jgi:hypothetical protein
MTTPTTKTTAPDTVSIPLPAIETHRPARRGEGWRVTMGRIEGRGTSVAAAKKDLAAQLATTVECLNVDPAFARDDDGALIVAVDRPWGIDTFRATQETARLISSGNRHPEGPAADLARVHHFTPLPAYTSGRAAGAPRPQVFTHAEITKALAAAQAQAAESSDTGALDRYAHAVLAQLAHSAPVTMGADATTADTTPTFAAARG